MLKLTQCMIVKNEEKNLKRALGWGKGLFQETIVIDTGSTDGTAALAGDSGAKVINFDWTDDFSAARNFAISQCTGDWIFFLDADEYFEDKDAALLRPLIEKIDGMYSGSKGEKLYYNVVETPWINFTNDGSSVSRQARIFRNVPYLRYSGAIHEQLQVLPGGYLKVYKVKDSPAICHTGYMWSEDNGKEVKGARYSAIAKKELNNAPESSKLKLFAAEALLSEGKYAEAEKYFSEAIKNSDGSIWPERLCEGYKQLLNLYMKTGGPEPELSGILDKAVRVYSEASVLFPDDADFDLLLSLLFFKAKDIRNTILFFSTSLSKKNGRISESLVNSNTYRTLCDICEKLKDDNIT